MYDFASIARWMESQSVKLPYGEISIKIIKHDDQVRQVEKSVTERERPNGGKPWVKKTIPKSSVTRGEWYEKNE